MPVSVTYTLSFEEYDRLKQAAVTLACIADVIREGIDTGRQVTRLLPVIDRDAQAALSVAVRPSCSALPTTNRNAA